MTLNEWRQQIETLQSQTTTLLTVAHEPEVFQQVVATLQTALEELHVAEEEMQQQHTAILEAQHRALQAQQQAQQLLQAVPDGYLVTDQHGVIRQTNQAAAMLLAVEQAFLIGKPLALFVAPEERSAFRRQLSALTSAPRRREWEVSMHPRVGPPFAVVLTVAPVQTLDNNMALLWLLRDITARQQVMAALRDSEARQRAIVETAVDGILTIDEQGHILSFNPAAERLFGYPAEVVLGQDIQLLVPASDRTEHEVFLARYLQTGTQQRSGTGLEARGQRRDGTTFPMVLAMSETPLEGQRRLFTVQDNGQGIAAADLPRVFDPFGRVERSDVPGAGLGLAAVHTLVRCHGGEITCQSALGVGTTFSFAIGRAPYEYTG